MTDEEYFNIKPCPNPVHSFRIWNMLVHWQIAADEWALVESPDKMKTYWLFFGKVVTKEGAVAYEFIFGRLSILWGFFNNKERG